MSQKRLGKVKASPKAGVSLQRCEGSVAGQGPPARGQLISLILLMLLVAIIVAVAHWPCLRAQALSYDDSQYLTGNKLVQNPSWASAGQFLSEVRKPSTVGGYYQPLPMISLMLDYAITGQVEDLHVYHRTSLILHVVNTLLLMVLAHLLLGNVWAAAGAALLFGVHPMTVEPITWIGERKTMLAACFSLWCLVSYVVFSRRRSWVFFGICLAFYILALLSKPTSTPLCLVLLLLDAWPLRRLKWQAVLEKIPFFVVGGISAVITIVSQRAAALRVPSEFDFWHLPLTVCHNIIFYLGKIVCPINLSSHYPFPEPMAFSQPVVAAGVVGTLVLLAVLAISLRYTRALAVGWLIFFVTALPTMQILRFSDVIASDKFAYLPSVGLVLILAWALRGALGGQTKDFRFTLRWAVTMSLVVLLAGAGGWPARRYLRSWQDSISLFQRMVALAPESFVPRFGYGCALQKAGRLDEALFAFEQTVRLQPLYHMAYHNMGIALANLDRRDEAIEAYRRAVEINPGHRDAHLNLALQLAQRGDLNEAVIHYRKALAFRPGQIPLINRLGQSLFQLKHFDEAEVEYGKVVRLDPARAAGHNNLGAAQFNAKKFTEAEEAFREALRLDPDYLDAHRNLGALLTSQGRYDEAIEQYRQALQIDPNDSAAQTGLKAARQKQAKQ